MSTGWFGYDTVRVRILGQRLVAATDELAMLVVDEREEFDVAAVRCIIASLRLEWIPVLNRIAGDTTMKSWTGAGADLLIAAVPRPPAGNAEAVARWWDGLSVAEQHSVIELTPALIGNRDGVPAWARDRANRQLLAADLERLNGTASAGVTDAEAAVLANARAADASARRRRGVRRPAYRNAGRRAVVHL